MDSLIGSVIELTQSVCELLLESLCNFLRVVRHYPRETFVGSLLTGLVVYGGFWQWHHSPDYAAGELVSRVMGRNFQELDNYLDIDEFSRSTAMQLYPVCAEERRMQVLARLFNLYYEPSSGAALAGAIKSRLEAVTAGQSEPDKQPSSLRYKGLVQPFDFFSCLRLQATRTMLFESPRGEVSVTVEMSRKSLASNFRVERLQSAPQLIDYLAAQEPSSVSNVSIKSLVGTGGVAKVKEKAAALKPFLRKLGSKLTQ